MKRPAYGHMIQRDYGSLRRTLSSQRTPREAHLWLHRTRGQTVRRVETRKDVIFRGYPRRRYLPCHRSREEGLVPTVRSSCDGRRHRDQEQFVRLQREQRLESIYFFETFFRETWDAFRYKRGYRPALQVSTSLTCMQRIRFSAVCTWNSYL